MSATGLLLLLLLVFGAAAPAAGASAPPGAPPTPDSLVGAILATPPESALHALARAYAAGSVGALDTLFTADFAFLSPGERPEPRLPEPSDRARELAAAADLFDAEPADSVTLRFEALVHGVDPEHADSTRHYQVLAVQRFAFDVRMGGRRVLRAKPALHVFHVVRGDAAARAPAQPADSTRWYLRLWLEDADRLAAALAEVRGDCAAEERQAPPPPEPEPEPPAGPAIDFAGSWVDSSLVAADSALADPALADSAVAFEDSTLAAADSTLALGGTERVPGEDEDLPPPAEDEAALEAAADSVQAVPVPPAPRVLAVEPLGTPSCPALDVRCDLPRGEPARLEVYDVTGRRVQRVEMGLRAATSLRVQAAAGLALAPGVYWLRLTQGGNSATRMVAVAG